MNPLPIHIDHLPSPLGTLLLAHGGGHLCALDFQEYETRFCQYLARRFGQVPTEEQRLPGEIHNALQAYLGGEISALDSIPVHAPGTRFQQLVWQTLRRIPAGQTWNYAQLAAAIGQPDAIRAVASANARNPVALVVPCHRVIGSDGGLTGYAGGLSRKHWLLVHEGARDAAAPEKAAGRRQTENRTLPLFSV